MEKLKEEMNDNMWWIPKSETNPRGFGINTQAIKTLIEKAKEKGNFVEVNYQHVDINAIKEKYWKMWYNLLKKLALEHLE